MTTPTSKIMTAQEVLKRSQEVSEELGRTYSRLQEELINPLVRNYLESLASLENKMKLEVGKTYRAQNGDKVRIVEQIKAGKVCAFYGDNFLGYTEGGRFVGGLLSNPLGLIAEWEEPEAQGCNHRYIKVRLFSRQAVCADCGATIENAFKLTGTIPSQNPQEEPEAPQPDIQQPCPDCGYEFKFYLKKPTCKEPLQVRSDEELRNWFAGMALQGLLSNSHPKVVAAFASTPELSDVKFAESAYVFADAMLKARKGGAE